MKVRMRLPSHELVPSWKTESELKNSAGTGSPLIPIHRYHSSDIEEEAGNDLSGRRGTNPWLTAEIVKKDREDLKMNKYIALVLFLTLVGINKAGYGQTGSGSAFLKVSPSPQSYALGGSGVVSSLGAQALSANPANLGLTSRRFELFSSFATLLQDEQYGHIALSMRLSPHSFLPIDSLGLSVTRLSNGSMSGTDSLGNSTGGFGSQDLAVGLGMSGRMSSNLRFGVVAKAIQEEIAGYRSNIAFAGNLGLSYSMPRFHGLSLGLSAENLGQGVKFLNETSPLPTALDAGAGVPMGPAAASVHVRRMVNDQKTEVGAGLDVGLGIVSFRMGYLTQQSSIQNLASRDQAGVAQMLGGMSGGMGIQMGQSARLDYAFGQPAVELGTSQRVALTLEFGGDSSRFNEVSKNHKQNTTVLEKSPWQQTGNDSVDWHMIRLEK